MQWWLSVFFFINGAWVPGDRIDGWASRAYPSESACLRHKAYAERECRDHPLKHEAYWMCSKRKPAGSPIISKPGVAC